MAMRRGLRLALTMGMLCGTLVAGDAGSQTPAPGKVGVPLPKAEPPTVLLRGSVSLRDGGGESSPLPDAVVVAVPVVIPAADRAPGAPSPFFGTASTRDSWCRYAARTDARGSFTLEVPPGRYRLLAGKLAVAEYRYWPDTGDGAAATWVRVPGDVPPPEGYRFTLSPLGELRRLEGRVIRVDPFGSSPPAPAGNVEVAALPLLPSLEGAPHPQRTRSHAGGEYALELPTDTPYLLRAAGDGLRLVWHPDAHRAADAVPFDPASPAARHGVDFRLAPSLPPSRGASIGGGARLPGPPPEGCAEDDPCPHPAAGVRVRVVALGPGPATLTVSTRTDGEGRFDLAGLPTAGPGRRTRYALRAEIEEGTGGVRLSSLPVEAGGRLDVGILTLAGEGKEARGWLPGRVVDASGAPVERASVRAYLWPPSSRDPGIETVTGPAGEFRFSEFPSGESVLLAVQAEGFVPAYYPGVSRWARAEPVEVSDGTAPTAPAQVVLNAIPAGEGGLLAVRVDAPPEAGSPTSLDPELAALEGAFVFATRAEAAGPEAPVWTGGATGPAGTTLLVVPEGELVLHVDRPGLETVTTSPERVLPAGDGAGPAAVRSFRLYPPLPEGGTREPRATRIADLQSLPNPFRTRTSFRYRLEEQALVTVQVFDYRGRLMRTLVSGEEQGPGPQSYSWNGRDEDGRRVSAGVYFFRVQAGRESASRKIVLLP